jgi:hypothetical protein
MATPLFWLLWSCGIAWLLFVFLRCLSKPTEMLGLPFVFAVFGGYFYVFMPYEAGIHLAGFLPPWTLEIGHACALLGLVSLWVGWWSSTRGIAGFASDAAHGNADRRYLFHVGLGGCWVAFFGELSFGAFNTEGFGESAYWYMLFQLAYPAAALAIIALVQDRRLRTPLRLLLLVVPVARLALPYLLAARRGPTVAWVLTILFAVVLGARRTPSRRTIVLGLTSAGVLALTIFAMRGQLERGESFVDAASQVSFEDIALRRTRNVADNEYVYHCALIGTTLTTGRYQYGTGHLAVLASWVPRGLWPDKPVRGGGLFPDARALMPSVTGISMGRGMAAGTIADSFVQYGYAFPLFWAFLGWMGGLIWKRALRPEDWFWKVTLVNLLACSHWLVAQSFGAFLVPMLFGQSVPIAGLLLERRRSRLPASGDRTWLRDQGAGRRP